MSQGGWGGGYGGGGNWGQPPGGGGYGPPPGPPPGYYGPPPGAPPGGPFGLGPGGGYEPPPPQNTGVGRFAKSALIGGLIGGAIASIPILGGVLNCCFCLPNMAGAAIGLWMYLKDNPRENISNGDAAVSGVFSGVAAGILASLLGLIMHLALGSLMAGLYKTVPREMRDLMVQSATSGAVGFVVNPPLYAAFGALGGFLSMQLFFKDRLRS